MLLEIIYEAWIALKRNRTRSALTMLAAAKPTLTEATAKTAHRATSATLLGTANLRMSGPVCRVCGMGR